MKKSDRKPKEKPDIIFDEPHKNRGIRHVEDAASFLNAICGVSEEETPLLQARADMCS